MEEQKYIFFKITGIIEPDYIITELANIEPIISGDLSAYSPYDALPVYKVEPIYLTQEEFNALPEFNG